MNRHQQEERGQAQLRDDVDEESRYGEAHRVKGGTVNKLDGHLHLTAGRFKCFRQKVDKNGFDAMKEKFFKDLCVKNENASLLAPNSQ